MNDGETWVNHDGYVVVRIGGVLKYQHRLVWEAAHGRPVPPGHVVHHRDRNKLNNDPANLEDRPRSDHSREHALDQARQRREARRQPPSQ